MNTASMISVIDDDESVRESLESLLKSVGFQVKAFTVAEFLHSGASSETDCLILDARLGDMSGQELQQELTSRPPAVPIVFITGHGDEAMRARVMADGAVDCLFKPFSGEALLTAVNTALSFDNRAKVSRLKT